MKQVFLGELISPARPRRAYGGAFPILSMTMHDGLVDQSSKFKKRVASADTSQYKVVERGQLVVGFPIDEAVLAVQGLYDEAIVSPAYGIWDLSRHVDGPYLQAFLRSPTAIAYYVAKLRGTTARRRSLPTEVFLQLPVPLPPLDEQRRIADILHRADAVRAKRREALAYLDGLAQSIFLDMFGDPVANPHGFAVRAFGDVCETRLGKMLDAKQQTGLNKRFYLRNANVQWFRFELDDLLEMDIDERSREILRLKPGDLLICEGGEPGRAAVWDAGIEECYFQKALHRARPDPELAEPLYVAWFLWFASKRGALKDYVTAATIAHLTGEKLRRLPLLLPPLDRQRQFVSRVGALENVRSRQATQLASLDAMSGSIQQRAFAGLLLR